MGIIKYPSNKNIEESDLQTHVALCEQRRLAIESRIDKLESRANELYDMENSNRRLVLGSLVTIASAILSTIVAILIKFNVVL
jgi:hypothetical protein